MLRLENCDLGPSSEPVLRDVSVDVGTGEFWVIIGPNGSGKTTLVRSFLGLLPPLSGRIVGPGEPGFGKRVAYVPQQAELTETLPTTPREWVRLGLAGLGLSRAERRERSRAALLQMRLSEIAHRDLSRLSAGQRQRAMVARALARQAALIVLDEPTEGLDAESRQILFDALDTHHANDGTVVLVTHRQEEAAGRAARLAVVDGGRVRTQEVSR
jgi:zinc transport system ATP-binding protein